MRSQNTSRASGFTICGIASHRIWSAVELACQIVGKLLGHTQAATTMRYADLQDDATRAAVNQFGKIIVFEKKDTRSA
jgi:hypothetical protein